MGAAQVIRVVALSVKKKKKKILHTHLLVSAYVNFALLEGTDFICVLSENAPFDIA